MGANRAMVQLFEKSPGEQLAYSFDLTAAFRKEFVEVALFVRSTIVVGTLID
jgi:hypothetical protein